MAADDSTSGNQIPVCAACGEVLEKDLNLASCNHVFHMKCLPAVDEPCPQCGQTDAGSNTLRIYGACFAFECKHVTPTQARLQSQISCQREKNDTLNKRLLDVEATAAKQSAKLEQVRRTEKKRIIEKANKNTEYDTAKNHYDIASTNANSVRNRRTVTEYLEKISESSTEARNYLMKSVAFADDPAVNLTEIGRIREYHKDCIRKRMQEIANKDQLAKKSRREKETVLQSIADLQRKLKRLNSKADYKPRPTLVSSHRPLKRHASRSLSDQEPLSQLDRLNRDQSTARLLAAASSSESVGRSPNVAKLLAAAGAGG